MSIGFLQILLVLFCITILFGAGKIPRIMKDFARGIKIFRTEISDPKLDQDTNASKTITTPKDDSQNKQ